MEEANLGGGETCRPAEAGFQAWSGRTLRRMGLLGPRFRTEMTAETDRSRTRKAMPLGAPQGRKTPPFRRESGDGGVRFSGYAVQDRREAAGEESPCFSVQTGRCRWSLAVVQGWPGTFGARIP